MTYNPGIPLPGDRPSDSQPQLLINFGQLNTLFARNHYEYNWATAADRGKHRFCTLFNQAAGPATGATEIALYSKILAGEQILYLRRKSNGAEIPMSVDNTPVNAATGRSFIPGHMYIQWGQVVAPSGESGLIPYSQPFAAPPWSIVVTPLRTAGANPTPCFVSSTHPPDAVNFRIVNTSTNPHTVYWMAIGGA